MTPNTPLPRTGATSTSGQSGSSVGENLCDGYLSLNPLHTNMSLVSSAHPVITTYVGNQFTGERLVVIHEGDGCNLGPRPPTMELSQPSGEYPTGIPQTGRRPLPRSLSTPFGQRRLQLRGFGLQEEKEKLGTEGTTRLQYVSPQQRDLCSHQDGSEEEEGGKETETTGGERLQSTPLPQRRKRRRTRGGERDRGSNRKASTSTPLPRRS